MLNLSMKLHMKKDVDLSAWEVVEDAYEDVHVCDPLVINGVLPLLELVSKDTQIEF